MQQVIADNESQATQQKQLLEREVSYLKTTMEQRTQRIEAELDLVKKERDSLIVKLTTV